MIRSGGQEPGRIYKVKNEFEDVKLSDLPLVVELPNKQLETKEKHLPTVCQKDEPK